MNWKNFLPFRKSKINFTNSELEKSDFEKITVFKNLPKEEWKAAYNELNKIIGINLKGYGFKKIGRKHYRLTNDLLEIIDIDNRGSWTGIKDEIEIRIGLVPYCWNGFTDEYYLIGSKRIEEIDKSIRKHFRLSQEYLILAEYISERIIKNVLPFFDKYNSTEKIVNQPYIFPYHSNCGGLDIYNSQFLILFSELKQQKIVKSIEILDNEIKYGSDSLNSITWKELKVLVENNNWDLITKILNENEKNILSKLKINKLNRKDI